MYIKCGFDNCQQWQRNFTQIRALVNIACGFLCIVSRARQTTGQRPWLIAAPCSKNSDVTIFSLSFHLGPYLINLLRPFGKVISSHLQRAFILGGRINVRLNWK